ncbi:hypothetical protein KVV02_000797 [Mortierella alpina]|uniref:Swiss Army Knife 2H phosphoesterase domain-containing protein n=1 Tax=Mortierella alpina TaxID=64518 RepID=A0A9P8CXT8_MORAP|nr:hypothetical protein KVV02_000797 [Mortierella alpina]
MRFLTTLLFTLPLATSAVLAEPMLQNPFSSKLNDDAILIDRHVFKTAKVPFRSHNGTQPFTNWVGLTLDYFYIQPVFDLVKSTESIANGTLRTRGEAHITVITPPEFDKILRPVGVTVQELNDLATMGPKRDRLQRAKFGVECLGRVQVVTQPRNVFQQAIQIILKDYEDLVDYRWDVFTLFMKKGGNPALFDPENFSPHVTLGYRHRDLFEVDGVFKRKNACIRKIVVV